jgi:hypothetical protein
MRFTHFFSRKRVIPQTQHTFQELLKNVANRMPTNPTAEIIGYTGGVFLAICCIPQFIKMYQNKSAKDVSLVS